MGDMILKIACEIPVLLLGFIGGVLYTRSVYKPTYRWQRRLILKQQRALAENKGYFR